MHTLVHWLRRKDVVSVVCVGLAGVWDGLFWGHPIGISVAVFAGVVGVVLLLRAPGLWKTGQGRVVMGLGVVALAALVEEPSILAVLMAGVAGTALILVSQRDLSLARDHVSAWFGRAFALLITLWVRILLDNVIVARWLARHPRIGTRVWRLARFLAWWILPVLAGLLFLGLFGLANPVIEQYLSHVRELLAQFCNWVSELSGVRLFFWLLVSVVSYGLLRYRHSWRRQAVVLPAEEKAFGAAWLIGPQMITRLLLVLNLVFLVENALDVAYLYCGVPLPKDMSYKEYAHRGAYTLIVTAMLAGVFTLAAFRRDGTAHRSAACRRLVYLWIGQNILLLISTVGRVCVYVEQSELTRLRLSTMIWSGLVASGFLWIIVRIAREKTNAWLWRMNALTTAAVLLVCGFINFDGLIAGYNVRHCAQAGGTGSALDVDYLRYLGTSSLPAIGWYETHVKGLSEGDRRGVEGAAAELRGELGEMMGDWRGWTLRRRREEGRVG